MGALFISFILLRFSIIHGCSLMTHTEIAERASSFFEVVSGNVDYNRLIARHPDAFQAGAPFPDAFYPGFCFGGNYHDVAEDTHWTPFIKAAVDYIRQKYPRPWSRETEKLVVFLLGVVQHQVADVTWHALGIEQGFLETMGKINYNGSFNAAHSAGDFGGDVLNVYELNMDYVGTITKWYVPTNDLLNIYTQLYGVTDRITQEVIENCTFILFMGRLGESLGAIDLLYPLFSANSPFLLDSLNDFFLGGMDDMAVWTQNVWRRTIKMLDSGTSACSLPYNPIYIRCGDEEDERIGPPQGAYEKPDKETGSRRAKAIEKWFSAVGDIVGPDSVKVTRTERGVYFSVDEYIEKKIEMRRKSLNKEISTCDPENIEPPTTFYSTREKYSRLGEQMTSGDINNDGYADAIISAPGYSTRGNYQQGRVYIVYGGASGLKNISLQLESSADQILNGPEKNSRFGLATLSLDLNADGLNDLVVSAPSYGSPTLNYFGRVYIYLSGARGQPLPSQPSVTIDCNEHYCNLGWSLSRGDVNDDGQDDLIIGSPFAGAGGAQRGMVGVIYASEILNDAVRLTEADFDWTWKGEQDYQWAGYSVSAGQTTTGSTLLVVGAPSHRICARSDCQYDRNDVQAVGKAFLFRSPQQSNTPYASITGDEAFEQLGAHVQLAVWNDEDVVIISSISAGSINVDTINGRDLVQAGTVNFYRIGSDDQLDAEPMLTLSGNRDLSRFGSNVIVFKSPVDGRSSALVSAPFRSADLTEDREGGRVYLFNDYSIGLQQINRTFGLNAAKSRFGSSIALVSSEDDSKLQLLIGAQHYTPASSALTQYRLEGIIGLLNL